MVIGVAIGFPTLKLAGPYFAMATIGFNRIVEMIFLNWVSVTGGPAGVTGIPSPKFLWVHLDTEESYYYLIAFVLFTLYVLYRNLITSHFGKTIIAMRDNAIAAQAMGINTSLLRISIFTISSIYAALAGSLYVHMVNYVAPDAFPVLESIALLIMVVLGGPGFLKGPIYGAIIVVLANEYLQYLESFNMLIYGAILMTLLVFLPSGVAGMIERLKYHLWGQKRIKDYVPEVGIEEMR
jgi:branched-chain amino acid transport system permease protein